MISFTNHYDAISIDRLPSKTKIGKGSWYFNNPLLCKPEFSSTTKTSCFIKNTKKSHSSASDRWEYTKSRFKENAKILSKNSATQENITISWNNLFLLLKTQKTTSSASVWWGNTKSSFTENARTFSKSSTTQENIKKNLQNELYQLKNKQVKGAKLCANIRIWRAKNTLKLSSK